MHLSAKQLARYRDEGYHLEEAVFSPAELEVLRGAAEDVVAAVVDRAKRPGAGPELTMPDGHRIQLSSSTAIQWEWADGSEEVRLLEPFDRLHATFEPLWEDPRFVEPMHDILELDEVGPFTSKLNLKRPREGSEFPYHQDYTYWYVWTPESAADVATAVLFLDDANRSNGAIRVLPGSHRLGPAPRDRTEPSQFLADPTQLETEAEITVEAPAGSLLFFGSMLVHRSSPNQSDHQRRAMLLSFQPAGRPRLSELTWRPDLVSQLP